MPFWFCFEVWISLKITLVNQCLSLITLQLKVFELLKLRYIRNWLLLLHHSEFGLDFISLKITLVNRCVCDSKLYRFKVLLNLKLCTYIRNWLYLNFSEFGLIRTSSINVSLNFVQITEFNLITQAISKLFDFVNISENSYRCKKFYYDCISLECECFPHFLSWNYVQTAEPRLSKRMWKNHFAL